MYPPTSRASSAASASLIHSVDRRQVDEEQPCSSEQGVYKRNAPANVSFPRTQLNADIPEDGRRMILNSENALRQYVEAPDKVLKGASKVEMMSAYLYDLMYYGQAKNYKELKTYLHFLNGVDGFGPTNQHTALERAQGKFHHGMLDDSKIGHFADSLQYYAKVEDGDPVRSLRKYYPDAFLNAQTIRSMCGAARTYTKAGGNVAQLNFDADPEGALALLQEHLPGGDALYAIRIALTKPIGYMSSGTAEAASELRNPGQKVVVRATQEPEPRPPQLRTHAEKHSLDSGDPTDQTDASERAASKRSRSDQLQQSTGHAESVPSWPFGSPLLSGRGLAGSAYSASSASCPDSWYQRDDEASIQRLALILSEDFREAASVDLPGAIAPRVDQSALPLVSFHPSSGSTPPAENSRRPTTRTVPPPSLDSEPGTPSNDHGGLLDEFLVDLSASAQQDGSIIETTVQQMQLFERRNSASSEFFEGLDRIEAESNP